MKTSFAQYLRQWRQARRYSQLQLALELGVSSRHLSFLETGRSQASREMILKISQFLLVPKIETNQALLAAGYAPIYLEQAENHVDLQPALEAIELMLTKQLPYPALVFNADWEVVNANSAAQNLLSRFDYTGNNFIEFLIADSLSSQIIINWADMAIHTLQRIHQETLLKGSSKRLAQLEQCLALRLTEIAQPRQPTHPLILSTQLQLGQQVLAFFSVLAQLSSVQDLTLSDYKIELMFPADSATSAFYQTN
ncbi:MAG: helix-turn-helix domain-containing protein [Thiolinea sp.]